MEEKREVLKTFMPQAVLRAMTPIAMQSVPQSMLIEGLVAIRKFPFRVGRESRVKIVDGRVERIERVRANTSAPNNDLYLIDDGHLLNISREHFQIERNGEKFYLYDRGSACGTIIGERAVGGEDRGETVELKDGDKIIIGTSKSPYIFQFIVLDNFEIREREG
jgi:pSer/pThr/pTyr-binding forkhead associated (FHA) protein